MNHVTVSGATQSLQKFQFLWTHLYNPKTHTVERDEMLLITFPTAWIPFTLDQLRYFSTQFPDLVFEHKHVSTELQCVGVRIMQNGQIVKGCKEWPVHTGLITWNKKKEEKDKGYHFMKEMLPYKELWLKAIAIN